MENSDGLNIPALVQAKKSALWVQKQLEDVINLEHARYISPEMEQELLGHQKLVLPEWNSILRELAATGWSEAEVLAKKEILDPFAQQDVSFARHESVAVDRYKPPLELIRGTNYQYLSPERVQWGVQLKDSCITVGELRRTAQFLDDIAFLRKEYKQDYVPVSDHDKRPVFPMFDDAQITRLLTKHGIEGELVQKTLISNASRMRKEIPYYLAAYARRQAFQPEVAAKLDAEKKKYGKLSGNSTGWAERETVDPWRDELLAKVYERIKNDAPVCKLVNGQAAGRFWHRRLRSTKFFPETTNAYWTRTLERAAFDRWLQSHDALFDVEYALKGSKLRIDFWSSVNSRLNEQYAHCKNGNLRCISEAEYKNLYPGAVQRLRNAFDDELLRYSTGRATAPAR